MKKFAMLWCALCALSPVSAAQSSYVMIDLGLPPARTALFAMDVDDTGRVLVYAPTGNGTRSYSWENGLFTDLGAMSGFSRMESADRDTASGVIVGSSWSSGGFPARAWKLTASGYQDLGALGGGNANAYAINAFGHVTGWAYAPAPANFFAFVHDGQRMHNLGEFVADITSTGFDINDSGGWPPRASRRSDSISRASRTWTRAFIPSAHWEDLAASRPPSTRAGTSRARPTHARPPTTRINTSRAGFSGATAR